MPGFESPWTVPFLALVSAVAVQRLLEMRLAREHARALVRRGALVVPADGYGFIVTVHVLWFLGMVAEWFLAPWAGVHAWSVPLVLLFLAGQALRYWAIRSLGERWTTRVIVLPGEARVKRGPYKWMDHPNYAAVAVELAALPLAFGAFGTAVAVSALNGIALWRRVRVENVALRAATHTEGPSGADAT